MIYVLGHQTVFKTDENGNRVAFFSDDDKEVDAATKEIIPLFAKALALQTDSAWDAYCTRFLELFTPFYEDFAPRLDGSVKPGTDVGFYWSPETLSNNHGSDYAYEYEYLYDYRDSLFAEAAKLNEYIEAVKTKTGHDKVILMSRCGGTNLAATYLSVYQKPINYAGIEKAVFVAGNLLGADFVEALLSGKLTFNADAAYRWLRASDLSDMVGEELAPVVTVMLDMLEASAGADGVCALLEKLYARLKDDLLAKFLKCNWGINAGFVAFVNEGYEDYKSYIFNEEGDLEKYAAIIEYLDRYHYEVQEKTEEDLLAMKTAGVEVDTVVYYGEQSYPLTKTADLTSDTVTSVTDQSYGGTASKITGKLSDAYIAARTSEGKGAYISADRQIDASTGLFPEQTWYVKNARHILTHRPLEQLVMRIARTKNIDVNTLPDVPQFLNYNSETQVLSPLQEKNDSDINWADMEKNAGKNGIRGLFELIKSMLQKMFDRIRAFFSITK